MSHVCRYVYKGHDRTIYQIASENKGEQTVPEKRLAALGDVSGTQQQPKHPKRPIMIPSAQLATLNDASSPNKVRSKKRSKVSQKQACSNKGAATANVSTNAQEELDTGDEPARFQAGRYVGCAESCWRSFHFGLHHEDPSITRLQVHLKDQQSQVFSDQADIERLAANPPTSTFQGWFDANKHDPDARDVLYADFPTKYVWNKKQGVWSKRKRGNTIGRMYSAHPIEGERYALSCNLPQIHGWNNKHDLLFVLCISF